MKDWTALETLAASARRLNRAIAGYELIEQDPLAIATQLDLLAEQFERGRSRVKVDEMSHLFELADSVTIPATVAVGDSFEFDPLSAAGGRFNPTAVGLTFVRGEDDMLVIAKATVDQMFQGPPDRVHGGVIAMIIDEVMGAANRISGTRAFTARLEINYRDGAPIDTELTFRAWHEKVDGRKLTVRAEGFTDAGRFADAEGLFVIPRDGRMM